MFFGVLASLLSAPAFADWEVSGRIQEVTPNTITLEPIGMGAQGSMQIQYLPYTKVKIKEYSHFAKRKYYTSPASLQPGDWAKEVEIIPSGNGGFYAKEIEIVR